MGKTYRYFIGIVGVVCVYFLVRLFFFTDLTTRTVRSDVVQGVLIGAGLAFVTAQVYGIIKSTKSGGWVTMHGCGEPGNGMFMRAAQAWTFPGPINVPEEAMYWWTNSDGAGKALDGNHKYIMHFAAGQLPQSDAFWSLTMGDRKKPFRSKPKQAIQHKWSIQSRAQRGWLCRYLPQEGISDGQ